MSEFNYQNPRPLPDAYLITPVTDAEIAFSTASGYLHEGGSYLSRDDGQVKLVPYEMQDVANKLFFNGGTVEQYGFRLKDGFDRSQVYRKIKQLLSSWEPAQEEKSATVGFLIQTCFEKV